MTLQTSAPVPFLAQYERFLAASAQREKVLIGFYAQARVELADFLANPPVPLTASEQAFFGALNNEVDRLATQALTQATQNWIQSVPASFVEGALQHSPGLAFNIVHDNAVRALSGYSLDLITRMSDDMRRVVQQQIGVGLLTGASREVVSSRILATGLTNIPHWRSVEARAEAIARTELMRAYNAGNLAGILDTGAVAVRWITGQDERVCPICGPRHGQTYALARRTPDGDDVPYPPLPGGPPPAHVKCRCTIRAFYGDLPGTVTEPTPVEGGMIDTTPTPTIDPGSFEDHLQRLRSKQMGEPGVFDAESAFWRDADLTDDVRLRSLTDAFADRDVLGFVLDARYGVKLGEMDQFDLWAGSADMRFHVLKGIESYRPLFARNIAFSERWNELQFVSLAGQQGKAGSFLAQCWQQGAIDLDLARMEKFLTRSLRGGETVNGIQEIVVHELGHALHNRFGVIAKFKGQLANYGPKAAELGGDYPWNNDALIALWKEWASIRRKTRAGVWGEGGTKFFMEREYQSLAARVDALDDMILQWDHLPIGPTGRRSYFYVDPTTRARLELSHADLDFARRVADGNREALRELKRKLDAFEESGEFFPTDYAKSGGVNEDFAESAMLYILNPEQLRRSSPLRYAFMRDRIFAEGVK